MNRIKTNGKLSEREYKCQQIWDSKDSEDFLKYLTYESF